MCLSINKKKLHVFLSLFVHLAIIYLFTVLFMLMCLAGPFRSLFCRSVNNSRRSGGQRPFDGESALRKEINSTKVTFSLMLSIEPISAIFIYLCPLLYQKRPPTIRREGWVTLLSLFHLGYTVVIRF